MCHYTKDPKLMAIIEQGLNMHDVVAKEMNVPRQIAKNLNLSAQYGIGAPKFAKMYGFTVPESHRYLAGYHKTLPGMRRLAQMCDRTGQERGYLRLWTGRVRHFNCARASTHNGSNALVQGGVAEMLRIAITRITKEVPEVTPVLTVHDSILVYAHAHAWREPVRRCKEIMEDQPWCDIPIVADVKVSHQNWADAKEVTL
jgi:DNA polymerase-1